MRFPGGWRPWVLPRRQCLRLLPAVTQRAAVANGGGDDDDDVIRAVVQMCECSNEASCDPISGQCICAPGWSGVQCNDSKLLLSSYYNIQYLSHTQTAVISWGTGIWVSWSLEVP